MTAECLLHLTDAEQDIQSVLECRKQMSEKEYADVLLILAAIQALHIDLAVLATAPVPVVSKWKH
jgi:hypothetical protein